MRIGDDTRKCVAFLGWQKAGPVDEAPIDPRGTGFFVHVDGAAYMVTARHVAEKLAPPFAIRVNKKGGGAGLGRYDAPDSINWVLHPDETVDIAVAPMLLPNWADVSYINMRNLMETGPKEWSEMGLR